jgi:2-polyprenyl-3-methyl-5-hydroxy-6-metoxy-1,4-benzoquinol methylase
MDDIRLKDRLTDSARRLVYAVWGSRLGHGCPVTRETWEKQFENGIWNVLRTGREEAHYQALAALCAGINPQASILDVGCGEAVLLEYLQRVQEATFTYIGTDIARQAVSRAACRHPGVLFYHMDAERHKPEGVFDLMVFNEVLYYFSRPLTVLRGYEDNLKPGGALIISMCEYPGHEAIWRSIDSCYKRIAGSSVTNQVGQRWNIAAYECGASSRSGREKTSLGVIL